jgi:hypothetical protein
MLKFLINKENKKSNKLLLHLIVLLLFSAIYHYDSELFIGHNYKKKDNDIINDKDIYDNLYDNKFINSLYFSAIIHTTVGLGRIYPVNIKAKVIVLTHILIVFSLIILL